jgi:hypothetical protein
MSDLQLSLLLIATGAFFSIHCTRASLKELRSGQALGWPFGDYDRTDSPIGFWLIMSGNFAAVVMGMIFLIAGLLGLLTYLEF